MISAAWRHLETVNRSALDATKKAFPNGKIICSMDKKAFRGWRDKQFVTLAAVEIPLLTTKQIIEMLDK